MPQADQPTTTTRRAVLAGAAAGAMLAALPAVAATVQPSRWAALSINDLACFYDAMVAGEEAFTSIMNQPRCTDDLIEEIAHEGERLNTLADEIVKEMASRTPVGRFEEAAWASMIFNHHFRVGGETSVLMDTARQLAANTLPA